MITLIENGPSVLGFRHHLPDGTACNCGCKYADGRVGRIIEEHRELKVRVVEFPLPYPDEGRTILVQQWPMSAHLDAQDREIVADRVYALHEQDGIRDGDYVDFANGVTRRVSHVWREPDWDGGVQTSDAGRWHLGEHGCSFSGGLRPAIDPATLSDTGELRDGTVWIFHHDHKSAGNGVELEVPCRVFSCTLEAN